MDLVVTTPGVSTEGLRPTLESESSERLLVIDRVTRCGATTVDPTSAARLRVAVAPCAVSLHAAERFLHGLAAGQSGAEHQSVDGVIVCREQQQSPPAGRLKSRFDCPVSIHTTASDPEYHPRY